jgi:hypothetical protein
MTSTRERYLMLPNRVGALLEGRRITVVELALVVWVGTKYEGTHGGFLTNKATIAEVLRCSMKTVQRALARTRELGLVRHDLRQGRTNFMIELGPKAIVGEATLDSAAGDRVQSDLGHGEPREGAQSPAANGFAGRATLDSRARKGLSEVGVDVSRWGTPT